MLICLIGPSGSGKSAIASELEKRGIPEIKSRTTRQPRFPGEDGYIFTDDYDEESAFEHTFYHGNLYWTLKEDFDFPDTKCFVCDPNGLKHLDGIDKVVVAVWASENVRRKRMKGRIKKRRGYTFKDYKDINKRITGDKETFRVIKCDYALTNEGMLEEAADIVEGLI